VAVGLVDPVAVGGRAGRAGSVADAVERVYSTARTRCASAGLGSHCPRSSNVQHLTPPPAFSSSDMSTPMGSKPRPRNALIR
jgi:hypothetical protein